MTFKDRGLFARKIWTRISEGSPQAEFRVQTPSFEVPVLWNIRELENRLRKAATC